MVMASTMFEEAGKDETVCDGSPSPICRSCVLVETVVEGASVAVVLVVVRESVVVISPEEAGTDEIVTPDVVVVVDEVATTLV